MFNATFHNIPVSRISGKIEKTVNILEVAHKLMTQLREYDTVARADNYFAEYRMLFLRRRSNDIVG